MRFLRVRNAEREHHLALPQRNGVDQRSLNLLRHQLIAGLNQANLRRHLNGNVARKFEVVELLFKAIRLVGQILCRLCILGQLRTAPPYRTRL